MIKPVVWEGQEWRVRFAYLPRRDAVKGRGGPVCTLCKIQPAEGEMLFGTTKCAPGDKPSFETGRKLALARALKSMPKEFRGMVWAAYLGRKG